MKTLFDIKTGSWNIDWQGRISRYDLVGLSPPSDPIHHGLAIGNGTLGALIWTQKDKIIIAVNRCDLWDDTKLDFVKNWDMREEDFATTLRHACRVVIDFKLPVFDPFYLSDFESRLSLSDACAHISAKSPMGEVNFSAYIDKKSGVLSVKLNSRLSEKLKCEMYIERFGSRTFSHWYRWLRREPKIGLDGTSAFVDGDAAVINQKLSGGEFFCRAVASGCSKPEVRHSRSAGFTFESIGESGLLLCVSSPFEKDFSDSACADLIKNYAESEDDRLVEHKKEWKDFWLRSYMDCGDDYLNALWHLLLYYLASSQGGSYPGRFINGLFGFERDSQNWNYYFHWNQQELYWGLNSAGHSELCLSYLNYRFNSMSYARKDAEDYFKSKGIYVSDVCDRFGKNSEHELYNRTPVCEIALDFWRQYKYTQDSDFLKQKCAPYMIEAARFFAPLFVKQEDGFYHVYGGSCYEGHGGIDDSITELACAAALLPKAVRAAEIAGIDLPERELWLDIADKLVPQKAVTASKNDIEEKDGKYFCANGEFKGEELSSDKIISAGWSVKYEKYLEIKDYSVYAVFPTCWYAPVFPSGTVSLRDKGSEVYDLAVNTLKAFAPSRMGWDTLPIALCRMGLGKEAEKELHLHPTLWQRYENGFGHYNPADSSIDCENEHTPKQLIDLHERQRSGKEEFFPFDIKPFRHMGLEPSGIFVCAMNERLLQSFDDGLIILAPAVTENTNAAFTLFAQGNLEVSAEIRGGEVLWARIKAHTAGSFSVMNPWSSAFVDGVKTDSRRIYFSLDEGDSVLLTGLAELTLEPKYVKYEENRSCRVYSDGKTMLGLPRKF